MTLHASFRYLLLAATIPVAISAFAQSAKEDKIKVKVRIGPEQRPDPTLLPYTILRSSPTTFLVMRSPEFDGRIYTKKGPRLDLYDAEKLVHIRSMEPAMKRMGQEQLALEELVMFGGKPLMIARNLREEEVALYWQAVDPFLTKQASAFDPICTFAVQVKVLKPELQKPAPASLTRDRFRAAVSRDGSHMLIHGPHMLDQDGKAYRLITAVDRNMKALWQHVLHMDARAERDEVLDATIDSTGTAYVLLRYRAKGRPYGEFTYETVLHKMDANDIGTLPINLPDGARPTGGILRTLAGGKVVWAGIHTKPGEGSGQMMGNFITTMELDSTGSLAPRILPFPSEGLSSEEISERDEASEVSEEGDEEEDKKKKSEKRLDWVTDVVELVERPEGGYYLVNEVGFEVSRIDGETRRVRRTYYHGPVLARSFGKEWEEQWSTLYKRWAVTGSPVTGKLMATSFEKQLYLFLIDSENLAELRKLKQPITPRESGSPLSTYAFFDEKGVFRTKTVLKGDAARDFFGGWRLVGTGKDEYVAFGADGLGGARYLPVSIQLTKEVKK